MALKTAVVLLLVALLVSSLAMVLFSGAQAQPIPKPLVPEFTIKLVEHPYDVAPVTTTDPYTGKTVTQHQGYHVENKSVELTIKNQPLPQLNYENQVHLYYNISYKGSFETEWRYVGWFDSSTGWFFTQSGSDYTVISLDILPDEGKMDYRVQAQIGSYTEIFYPMQFMDTHYYTFNGEVSGWSSTQTIEVPAISQSNPTPSSTASSTVTSDIPRVPENQVTWLLIVAIAGLGAVVAVLSLVIASLASKIRVLERKLAD